nr:immunoglobulin light chain junction region [Macaca mulatta]
CQHYYSIPGSF